jgi:GT2 family glycosyltransferase
LNKPLFSIVTPVYEPPLDALQAALESVTAQTFSSWQLILVDDRSPSDSVRDLLTELASADDRIEVIQRAVNGGISAASNDAIAAADGDFIVLLDHDDALDPRALELMAAAIGDDPMLDYLYSDEDKIDVDGSSRDEFVKPDWSPERLRHSMYTCHLSVLRTALVREVGGFHSGFDGSQDHDLVLRVTERARRVGHVRQVLYHWRIVPGSTAQTVESKPYAWQAGRRAVQAQMDRLGLKASVELGRHPGYLTVERELAATTRVSIVIPTRGSSGLIWGQQRCFVVEAVRSALARTNHRNLEIVVVYDESTPEQVLVDLKTVAGAALVLVPFAQPFNFSAKCNVGFLHASGDVIVLLNDDTEARSDRWLETLVAPLEEPDVGLVGARLLLADSTIQHAGHVYTRGDWMHAYYGRTEFDHGDFGSLLVDRECSGVTGACLAVRSSVYEELGGLSEAFPHSYNDVDLSLKARSRGFRVLWMAESVLYHFESQTREKDVLTWERDALQRRWGRPSHDAYLPTI